MPPTVPPAKILLVDDKPENLVVFEAVLGDSEYRLFKARSGEEALSLLKGHPDVALILLDVQMPDMSGFEVSRRIKEFPEYREIPIVLVTAIYKDDPFVKEGYKAGAIDYFSKPIDPEILRAKVGIYSSFRQRMQLLRERERLLRESEALFKAGQKLTTTLESLPIGVIIADTEGRVRETNEEVLTILKSIGQIHAGSNEEFMTWWERNNHFLKSKNGPLMSALSSNATRSEIISIRCEDGTSKSVFVSASPLHSSSLNFNGAAVILQNVTTLRNIESDIEKQLLQLVG